ncbi:MAG: protein translocase subunit SecD [Bacteroidota bacterium]
MKKNRAKIVLIVGAVALALYFLYPTYKDYRYTQQLKNKSGDDSLKFIDSNEKDIRNARLNRMKLGLDLQGGMRVVLEVNVVKFLKDMARSKDDVFNGIMAEIEKEAQTTDESIISVFAKKFEAKGIRLSRYYGKNIRDEDKNILSNLESESDKAVDRAMEIVRNRVDQYGVSEPTIQKQGARRIIVELPGISKESEVRQLLQGTALLEFKLLKDPEISYKIMETIDKYLAGKGSGDSLNTTDSSAAISDSTAIAQGDTTLLAQRHPFYYLARPHPQGMGTAYVAEDDRAKVNRILNRDDVKLLLPNDVQFLWSSKPELTTQDGRKYYELYIVKATPELTGGVIVNAHAVIGSDYNQPEVTMEMNSEGAREWARITGANVNKRIAIIMDNAIFSAPKVITKITGGHSQITGMQSIDEAKLLEIVLKAGALPAPVDIIEQRNVGPSLGEDSIRSGVTSTAYAFIFTVLFMIIYYRTGGSVAVCALLFNVLFILGVLAGFQATLTLPGIAGIILTFATSVDANVLIYERIREESAGGKTLVAAIDSGYKRAFSAIIDSNVTTFLTGVIMYQFGTGPVQGFALTLMIGILSSLFSALIITRVIFDTMTERGMHTINFG